MMNMKMKVGSSANYNISNMYEVWDVLGNKVANYRSMSCDDVSELKNGSVNMFNDEDRKSLS